MKDPWADGTCGVLQTVSDSTLVVKKFPQFIMDHRERASLLVLRRSGIESNFTGLEVHLPPLKRLDFARDTPTGDVSES